MPLSTRHWLGRAWVIRPLSAPHREAGVTVVELAVVIVIIGLLAISVMPVLQDVLTVNRAKGAGEQVAAAVRLARQYAIGESFQYNVTITSGALTIACETGCPSGAATEPQVTVVDDGTISCFLGDDTTACTTSTIQFTSTGTAVAARTLHVSVSGVADQRVCVSGAGRVVLTSPGAACP